MKTLLFPAIALLFWGAAIHFTAGAEPAGANVSEEKNQASQSARNEILNDLKGYAEAYNRGDVEAAANHYTDNIEHIDADGNKIIGRDAIKKELKDEFAENPGQRLKTTQKSFELLKPGLARATGTTSIAYSNGDEDKSDFTATFVKQGDKWLINKVEESEYKAVPNEHLVALEWMVGDWTDKDENASIVSNVAWTENKLFLTRAFSVFVRDRVDIRGTEVIGWDPVDKIIRSWMFDSDGGIGESTWRQEGKNWVVTLNGKLRNGKKASAVQYYTPIDANSYTWKSTQRVVGGKPMPDIGPITIVRANPEISSR